MRRQPGTNPEERRCACGAQLEERQRMCRKCRARVRWQRRVERAARKARRASTRDQAHPSVALAMGVSAA